MRRLRLLVVLGVLGALVYGGVTLFHSTQDYFRGSDTCTAKVDGTSVQLTTEQAENAGLIAAIAVRRGMPARAVTIALATAFQESKLYNLAGGDRDSLGLFQQRPSQGWGTPRQILDPAYATNAFYDALERIGDYQSMEVTVAAQAVQRSGFPGAYAAHEADARVLASALTGNSPHAFGCDLAGSAETSSPHLRATGLTRRADVVRQELAGVFGSVQYAAFGAVDGRQVEVLTSGGPDSTVRGWAIAQYAVAQADRLHVRTVSFEGRTWTNGEGAGWARDDQAAERRVRVEVFV